MKIQLAILISGRGSNMEKIIHEAQHGILKNLCNIAIVISNNPKAEGLKKAEKLGILTACIPSTRPFDKELITLLKENQIEFIALGGFNRILPHSLISLFPKRIVNIHPADPKQYKGLCGYKWAHKHRLKKTAVTVHIVDEGIDTGEILAMAPVDLRDTKTLEEVEAAGLSVEHKLYSKTLFQILSKMIQGGSHVRNICSLQ